MFAVLDDQSTRATIDIENKSSPSGGNTDVTKFVRTENRVVIIDAAQIAKTVGQDTSKLAGFVARINQALPNAAGIVFDWRVTHELNEFEAFYFETFMRQTLTGMLDTTVTLGSSRHRMHSGYPTQTASGASFYYSALVSTSPQTIAGRAKTKPPPLAFIVNHNSPAFADILSGLQASNHAFIIQDGDQPQDASSGTYTMDLPDKLKVRIRTSELINPDGSIDLQPDAVLNTSSNAMNEAVRLVQENKTRGKWKAAVAPVLQISQKDKPYAEMQFPNRPPILGIAFQSVPRATNRNTD